MYRLRSLDSDVAAMHNPPRKPIPQPAMPLIDRSLGDFIEGQPKGFTHVAVSAAVFHGDRLLLVQRSETDSYPGHWEMPGGSADPTDKSISESVARELFEETGFTMKHIVQEILPPTAFITGWGKRQKTWLKVSFVVDVTEAADLKAEEKIRAQQGEEKMRKDSVVGTNFPTVRLDPEEHQKHLWVTAEDIIKCEVQGGSLQFISADNVATMLEAFGVRKQARIAKAKALQTATEVNRDG